MRYDDCDSLNDLFLTTFKDEVGGLAGDKIEAIKLARMTGMLLSRGLTSRLANQAEPVPIGEDECGRYNMLSLDVACCSLRVARLRSCFTPGRGLAHDDQQMHVHCRGQCVLGYMYTSTR